MREGSTSGTNSVDWQVTGGGANLANGLDFVGGLLPSGTLTFAPGQTFQLLFIPVAGDPQGEYDEGFTVTLSNPFGATISTASADVTIIDDDAAPSVVQTFTDITNKNIALTGDSGPDTLTVNLNEAAVSLTGFDINVIGLGMDDAITVGLAANTAVFGNTININGGTESEFGEYEGDLIDIKLAGTKVSNNTISVDGGYGDDTINLSLLASDVSTESATATNAANVISMTGGDGNDGLNALLAARALASHTDVTSSSANADASYAGAFVHSNTVNMYGGEGNDTLSVTLTADASVYAFASATSGTAEADGYYAYATVNNNFISMTGGDGNDTLTALLAATAKNSAIAKGSSSLATTAADAYVSSAYASVNNNTVNMSGGAGTDTLTLNLTADASIYASATAVSGTAHASAYTYAYVTADVSGNIISMTGGDGNDSLTVNLIADASVYVKAVAESGDANAYMDSYAYVYITADVYDNTITMTGGAGDDTLSALLAAKAQASLIAHGKTAATASYSMSTANFTAYNNSNDIKMYGGAGSDTLSLTLSADASVYAEAIASSGDANAQWFQYYYTGYISAVISGNGTSSNPILMTGGSGNDTLTVNLMADASLYVKAAATNGNATASVENYYSYVYVSADVNDNIISMDGGTGNDTMTLGLTAVASIYAEASAISGDANAVISGTDGYYITADADVNGNTIFMTGGAGDDTLALTLSADALMQASALAPSGSAEATIYYSYAEVYADVNTNTITMNGGGDNDTLSALLRADVSMYAKAIGSTYAGANPSGYYNSASVNNNAINMDGGTGNDTLTLTLSADASLYAFASATATTTGTGTLGGSADATAYSYASADVSNNTITMTGGAGDDTLSALLAATAKITAIAKGPSDAEAYAYSYASANVSSNTVKMYGGTGTDTLTVTLTADASVYAFASAPSGSADAYAYYASADVYNNAITMTGGAGDDTLSAMLAATAKNIAIAKGATDAYASGGYAAATVSGNSIIMDGGDGIDTLTLNLTADASVNILASAASGSATAYYYYATANINNNIITMTGGAGDDTLSAMLAATAYDQAKAVGTTADACPSGGWAYVNTNNINMYGGGGNDSLTLTLTADVDVYGTAIATSGDAYLYGCYYSVIAEVNNNAISMTGSTGNDTMTVNLLADAMLYNKASAIGGNVTNTCAPYYAFIAEVSNNAITMAGGSGSDVMTVNLEADASMNLSMTASGGDAIAYYVLYSGLTCDIFGNTVNMYGGSGNDTMSMDLAANAELYAGVKTIAGATTDYAYMSVYYTVSANVSSNVIFMDGGMGTDTMTLSLTADMSVDWEANGASNYGSVVAYYYASADVSNNAITMTGGDGDDSLTAMLRANVDVNLEAYGKTGAHMYVSSDYATANVYNNTIKMTGGTGVDTLSLDLKATAKGTAIATATSASANADASMTAYASVNNNTITMDGGDEGDTLTLNITASASAAAIAIAPNSQTASATAEAYISNNTINMYGGAGDDTLTLHLSATATASELEATSTAAVPAAVSVTASISNNTIKMTGGSGVDTFDLTVTAISGNFSNNTISIDGGAGNDIINLNFNVSAATGNKVTVWGGTGSDTISIGADVNVSDAHFIFKYAGITELGDNINGLTAGHDFSLAFKMTGFNGFTSRGALSSNATDGFAFVAGSAAVDANDYWINNPVSSALYYDADANGTAAQVTVAQFNADVDIAATDITGYPIIAS